MDKKRIKEWIVLKTINFNTIYDKLETSREFGLLNIIIGFPGAGKTTAFKNYIKSHQKNTVYLCLDKSYHAKDFYVELLRKLDVLDYGYDLPIRFLAQKIAETLRSREENTLIIIDDAGRFTAPMMEWFQLICDASKKCGVVLSGTKKFEKDFERWVKEEKLGVPELNSRVDEKIVLKEPSPDELAKVALRNGVTDASVLKEILKDCHDYRRLNRKIIALRIKKLKKERVADTEEALA